MRDEVWKKNQVDADESDQSRRKLVELIWDSKEKKDIRMR